jgi:pantoate--beta-alanine ligase
MSSRNGYLSAEERGRAPALYRTLLSAADALRAGRPIPDVELEAYRALEEAGLRPDYLSVRRREDLAEPGEADQDLVILAAAFLGRARLIDNMALRRTTHGAPQQTLG